MTGEISILQTKSDSGTCYVSSFHYSEGAQILSCTYIPERGQYPMNAVGGHQWQGCHAWTLPG